MRAGGEACCAAAESRLIKRRRRNNSGGGAMRRTATAQATSISVGTARRNEDLKVKGQEQR